MRVVVPADMRARTGEVLTLAAARRAHPLDASETGVALGMGQSEAA